MKKRKVREGSDKRTVALIMPPVPRYSRQLIEGVIERHVATRSWHLIDLPHLKVGRSPLPFHHDRLDGVILWADRRDAWIERLAEEGVKIVNCGSDWIGAPGVANVYIDRSKVGKVLVDHLEKLALRQLVIVGYLLSRRPGMQKFLDGVAAEARQSGMEVAVWELEGRNNPEDAPRRVLEADREHKLRALLGRIPKPAAIFCESDHIGVLICRVARLCGIRIPDDLSVVGYGNNLVAQYCNPPLTSMCAPGLQVGAAAADLLASWFDGGATSVSDIVVPHVDIEVRESTVGRSGSAELERVRRYIQRSDGNALSLTTMAGLIGVSTRTLVRRYMDAFGEDPLDYARSMRLEKVKTLLEEGVIPIGEVSKICSFSTPASFYNYFQRHMGISPTDYRKKFCKDGT